jgi:ABC-type sugar transport system permease subunit
MSEVHEKRLSVTRGAGLPWVLSAVIVVLLIVAALQGSDGLLPQRLLLITLLALAVVDLVWAARIIAGSDRHAAYRMFLYPALGGLVAIVAVAIIMGRSSCRVGLDVCLAAITAQIWQFVPFIVPLLVALSVGALIRMRQG